jgi:hypothetical protein
VARGVSIVLAVGAVLGVGAAAYSRGVNNDAPTTPLAGSRDLPTTPGAVAAPLGQTSAPKAAPARSDAARAKEPAKVKIGALRLAYDDMGLTRTSLPITVTNNTNQTRSFDVKVVAKSPEGNKITSDTATAANLRPGQSAQVQVLEIVNQKLIDELKQATFEVAEIFAY